MGIQHAAFRGPPGLFEAIVRCYSHLALGVPLRLPYRCLETFQLSQSMVNGHIKVKKGLVMSCILHGHSQSPS